MGLPPVWGRGGRGGFEGGVAGRARGGGGGESHRDGRTGSGRQPPEAEDVRGGALGQDGRRGRGRRMVVAGAEGGVVGGGQAVGEPPDQVGGQVDEAQRGVAGGDLGEAEAVEPGGVGADAALAVRGDEDAHPAVGQDESRRFGIGGEDLAGVQVEQGALHGGGDGPGQQAGGLEVGGERRLAQPGFEQPVVRRLQRLGDRSLRPGGGLQEVRPWGRHGQRTTQDGNVVHVEVAPGPGAQAGVRGQGREEGA